MKYRKRLVAASSAFLMVALLVALSATPTPGQQSPAQVPVAAPAEGSNLPQPMNWQTADDHRNMMEQLGIKALRPGPSGKPDAPNSANYDESLANPFPDLPDVLTLKNGRKVTTAKTWWKQRRPEIIEDFEREVVGRVPRNVPSLTWKVINTVNTKVGSHPVIGKELVGHVDNSAYPLLTVDIQMTLVTPADATGRVPVMMMFGRRGLPQAGEPAPATPGPSRDSTQSRSTRHGAAHCRRVGLRLHQPCEYPGR